MVESTIDCPFPSRTRHCYILLPLKYSVVPTIMRIGHLFSVMCYKLSRTCKGIRPGILGLRNSLQKHAYDVGDDGGASTKKKRLQAT